MCGNWEKARRKLGRLLVGFGRKSSCDKVLRTESHGDNSNQQTPLLPNVLTKMPVRDDLRQRNNTGVAEDLPNLGGWLGVLLIRIIHHTVLLRYLSPLINLSKAEPMVVQQLGETQIPGTLLVVWAYLHAPGAPQH